MPSPRKGLLMEWVSYLNLSAMEGTQDILSPFMSVQTMNVQTGYKICLKSHSNLIKETEPEFHSVSS